MRRTNREKEIEWCCIIHQGYGDHSVEWYETEAEALEHAKEAEEEGARSVYVLRCKWQASDTAAEIADVEAT